MSSESPASIIYSSLGVEISAPNGSSVGSTQPGLLIDGYNYSTGLAQLVAVNNVGDLLVAGSGTAGSAATGVLTIQGISGMTSVLVNTSSGVFNSGAVSSTGSAAPSSAELMGGSVTTAAPAYSNNTMNSLSLTTSGQLRIDGVYPGQTAPTATTDLAFVGGSVTTSSPTYTTGQMSALSLTTAGALRVDGSAVTQPVSGTVTANAGTGNYNNSSVSATAASPPSSATYMGALVNTSAPAYTNGQMDPLSLTTAGLLRIDGVYPVNATTPTSDVTFIGAAVTTSAPSYTTGQLSALSLTTVGNLRVDGSSVTQPVTGTGTAGTPATGVVTIQGISGGTAIPVSGTLTVDKSTVGTMTSVAASTSSVTALASNANRISAAFYNDSSSVCFLAISATAASNTAYTIRLLPNSYTDLNLNYTGQCNAIWTTAVGSLRVTEWT
jgi:hypothetical protein